MHICTCFDITRIKLWHLLVYSVSHWPHCTVSADQQTAVWDHSLGLDHGAYIHILTSQYGTLRHLWLLCGRYKSFLLQCVSQWPKSCLSVDQKIVFIEHRWQQWVSMLLSAAPSAHILARVELRSQACFHLIRIQHGFWWKLFQTTKVSLTGL